MRFVINIHIHILAGHLGIQREQQAKSKRLGLTKIICNNTSLLKTRRLF
jgi:hypothetical protein